MDPSRASSIQSTTLQPLPLRPIIILLSLQVSRLKFCTHLSASSRPLRPTYRNLTDLVTNIWRKQHKLRTTITSVFLPLPSLLCHNILLNILFSNSLQPLFFSTKRHTNCHSSCKTGKLTVLFICNLHTLCPVLQKYARSEWSVPSTYFFCHSPLIVTCFCHNVTKLILRFAGVCQGYGAAVSRTLSSFLGSRTSWAGQFQATQHLQVSQACRVLKFVLQQDL